MKKGIFGTLLLCAMMTTACGDLFCEQIEAKTVLIETEIGNFYIDAYEASRSNAYADTEGNGVTMACNYQATLPWDDVTFEDARNACLDAGKRLCTKDEWLAACGSAKYPYGATYKDTACNDDTNAPMTTGSKTECVTPSGVYDMTGNLQEWVEEGYLMGGSYSGGGRDNAACQTAQEVPDKLTYTNTKSVGFRCCSDTSLLNSGNLFPEL
jgi:formylglycine-generating enzyme required for sulfatase activity